MRYGKTVVLICLLWPFSLTLSAQDKKERSWYKPDLAKYQFAGNIGFMSIGVGYNWWREVAQTDIMYGFVPEHHGDAVIHTFTLKNTFSIYEFIIFKKYNISPTMGFSISLEPGENSYMRVPDRYPDDYYGPNNIYACLNLGLKSNFRFKEERYFSSVDVYSEINTVADYGFYNAIAKEDHSLIIYSLAIGINMFF